MKALDILNEINNQLKRSRDYNRFNIEIQFNKTYQVKVEEAIKELEDLKNRSCKNCKYNKEQDDFMIFCDKEICQNNSKMMWHSFTKDFCCKYWESK